MNVIDAQQPATNSHFKSDIINFNYAAHHQKYTIKCEPINH